MAKRRERRKSTTHVKKKEALIYLRQALKIYGELQDKGRTAAVLQAMADVHYFANHQAKAAESLEQALPVYREIGHRLGEAQALWSLGQVKLAQGAYDEAEKLYVTALGIYASIEDSYNQGVTLLSLTDVYRSLGDLTSARSAARQAKELFAPFPQMMERAESILQELS